MTYLQHLDQENPLGVLGVTIGKLRQAIEALPEDLLYLDEKELKAHVNPTNTDYCLRVAFWREYEALVRSGGEHLKVAAVINGVCSDAYFYQKFVKDTYRVAWLIRPMQSYMTEIEAVLAKATERLWELMDIDITFIDKTGRRQIDAKKASVLLETIKMVEARAKGHAVIRSEAKALNVHVSKHQTPGGDQASLERRMAELSKKIHGADIIKVIPDGKD